MFSVIRTAFAAGIFVSATTIFAADQPEVEQIPAPRTVAPAKEFAPPSAMYYRTSRYDVWQYYGVDRTGHFRPRVIDSPYGAYYLYNGAPFPWASTHQGDYSMIYYGSPPPYQSNHNMDYMPPCED